MNITTKTIYSNSLSKDCEYRIIKTEGRLREAYVLYVQDGDDYLEIGGLMKTYQHLLETNPIAGERLVFILIPPGTSIERWNAYHRNGKNFETYNKFINEELIPEVEQELTDLQITIVKQGLLGDSLAGNSSLNIAVKNPEKWTHLLLQSAAVSPDDIFELSKLHEIHWKVYQTVGLYEDEFVSPITNEKLYILTRNRELYKIFNENKTDILYVEKQEHHLWEYWKRDLPDALNYFILR